MTDRFENSFFSELDTEKLNMKVKYTDNEKYKEWERDQELGDIFARLEEYGRPSHHPKLDSEKKIVSVCFIGEYISYKSYQSLINATEGHLVVITRDIVEQPNNYHKIMSLFIFNGKDILYDGKNLDSLTISTDKGTLYLKYTNGSPMYKAVLKIAFEPSEINKY